MPRPTAGNSFEGRSEPVPGNGCGENAAGGAGRGNGGGGSSGFAQVRPLLPLASGEPAGGGSFLLGNFAGGSVSKEEKDSSTELARFVAGAPGSEKANPIVAASGASIRPEAPAGRRPEAVRFDSHGRDAARALFDPKGAGAGGGAVPSPFAAGSAASGDMGRSAAVAPDCASRKSLICRLGNGPLSQRVFVVRSVTQLNEDIVQPDFSQTRVADLMQLFGARAGGSRGARRTAAAAAGAAAAGAGGAAGGATPAAPGGNSGRLWPELLIWDFPVHRPGLARELADKWPHVAAHVLTYRLLDVGAPALALVARVCASLLWWLDSPAPRAGGSRGAVLSFYESDSGLLALLGCVLACLDGRNAAVPPLQQVCDTLAENSVHARLVLDGVTKRFAPPPLEAGPSEVSSAALAPLHAASSPPYAAPFVPRPWSPACTAPSRHVHGTTAGTPAGGVHFTAGAFQVRGVSRAANATPLSSGQERILRASENFQRSRNESRGVLSWRPLSAWAPSARRLLRNFHALLHAPVANWPLQVRSVVLQNVPGPAATMTVEIYEVYTVAQRDGKTVLHESDRRRRHHRRFALEHGGPGTGLAGSGECSPGAAASNERRQQLAALPSSSDSSSDGGGGAATSIASKLKSAARRLGGSSSGGAARRCAGGGSPGSGGGGRGCRLLGGFGSGGAADGAEAASLQCRLVADFFDYRVMDATNQAGERAGEAASVVLDFNRLNPHLWAANAGTENGCGDDLRNATVVSGDFLLVVRQLGSNHAAACKDCAAGTARRLKKSDSRRRAHPSRERRVAGAPPASAAATASVGAAAFRHLQYDEGDGIFAVYAGHTGFLSSAPSTPGFLSLGAEDFDVPPAFAPLLSSELRVLVTFDTLDAAHFRPGMDGAMLLCSAVGGAEGRAPTGGAPRGFSTVSYSQSIVRPLPAFSPGQPSAKSAGSAAGAVPSAHGGGIASLLNWARAAVAGSDGDAAVPAARKADSAASAVAKRGEKWRANGGGIAGGGGSVGTASSNAAGFAGAGGGAASAGDCFETTSGALGAESVFYGGKASGGSAGAAPPPAHAVSALSAASVVFGFSAAGSAGSSAGGSCGEGFAPAAGPATALSAADKRHNVRLAKAVASYRRARHRCHTPRVSARLAVLRYLAGPLEPPAPAAAEFAARHPTVADPAAVSVLLAQRWYYADAVAALKLTDNDAAAAARFLALFSFNRQPEERREARASASGPDSALGHPPFAGLGDFANFDAHGTGLAAGGTGLAAAHFAGFNPMMGGGGAPPTDDPHYIHLHHGAFPRKLFDFNNLESDENSDLGDVSHGTKTHVSVPTPRLAAELLHYSPKARSECARSFERLSSGHETDRLLRLVTTAESLTDGAAAAPGDGHRTPLSSSFSGSSSSECLSNPAPQPAGKDQLASWLRYSAQKAVRSRRRATRPTDEAPPRLAPADDADCNHRSTHRSTARSKKTAAERAGATFKKKLQQVEKSLRTATLNVGLGDTLRGRSPGTWRSSHGDTARKTPVQDIAPSPVEFSEVYLTGRTAWGSPPPACSPALARPRIPTLGSLEQLGHLGPLGSSRGRGSGRQPCGPGPVAPGPGAVGGSRPLDDAVCQSFRSVTSTVFPEGEEEEDRAQASLRSSDSQGGGRGASKPNLLCPPSRRTVPAAGPAVSEALSLEDLDPPLPTRLAVPALHASASSEHLRPVNDLPRAPLSARDVAGSSVSRQRRRNSFVVARSQQLSLNLNAISVPGPLGAGPVPTGPASPAKSKRSAKHASALPSRVLGAPTPGSHVKAPAPEPVGAQPGRSGSADGGGGPATGSPGPAAGGPGPPRIQAEPHPKAAAASDPKDSRDPRRFPGQAPGFAPGSILEKKGQHQPLTARHGSLFPGKPPGRAPGAGNRARSSDGTAPVVPECVERAFRSAFPGRVPGLAPGKSLSETTLRELSKSPGDATARTANFLPEISAWEGVLRLEGRSAADGAAPGQAEQAAVLKCVVSVLERRLAKGARALAPPPARRPPAASLTRTAGLGAKAPFGRKILWKPLRETNIEGTIFAEIAKGPEAGASVDMDAIVNSSHMELIFTKPRGSRAGRESGESGAARPTAGAIGGRAAAAPATGTALLEPKRAQNVSIVLARLGQSPLELARAVAELDVSAVSPDALEKLRAISPTPEEAAAFDAFIGPRPWEAAAAALKPVPERQVAPLAVFRDAYRLAVSVNLMHEEFAREGRVADLRAGLTLLRKATAEVRSSNRLRQVLSVVLRWGNFVNHGVAKGELAVRGFTLGSLLKLTEFKTTVDPTITSLHFLTANMLHSAPSLELHLIGGDMPTVPLAAKVSTEALTGLLDALRRHAQALRAELEASRAALAAGGFPGVHADLRLARLAAFEAGASEALAEMEGLFQEVHDEVFATGRFFGDESAHQAGAGARRAAGGAGAAVAAAPPPFLLESLFITLREFLAKFHDCCRDVKTRPKKYAILLAAAAAVAVTEQAGASGPPSAGPRRSVRTPGLRRRSPVLKLPGSRRRLPSPKKDPRPRHPEDLMQLLRNELPPTEAARNADAGTAGVGSDAAPDAAADAAAGGAAAGPVAGSAADPTGGPTAGSAGGAAGLVARDRSAATAGLTSSRMSTASVDRPEAAPDVPAGSAAAAAPAPSPSGRLADADSLPDADSDEPRSVADLVRRRRDLVRQRQKLLKAADLPPDQSPPVLKRCRSREEAGLTEGCARETALAREKSASADAAGRQLYAMAALSGVKTPSRPSDRSKVGGRAVGTSVLQVFESALERLELRDRRRSIDRQSAASAPPVETDSVH